MRVRKIQRWKPRRIRKLRQPKKAKIKRDFKGYWDYLFDGQPLSMQNVASLMRYEFNTNKIGRNRLMKLMRKMKILDKKNLPTERYCRSDYFHVAIITTRRKTVSYEATRVLPIGIKIIRKLIIREYRVRPIRDRVDETNSLLINYRSTEQIVDEWMDEFKDDP